MLGKHIKWFNTCNIEKISEISTKISKDGIQWCYYIDMVEKYRFQNEKIMDSFVLSKELNLANFNVNRKINIFRPKRVNRYGISSELYDILGEDSIELTKTLYNKITIEIDEYVERNNLKNDIKSDFMDNLIDNRIVQINKLISRKYYDNNFIKKINETAISYYKDLIGKEYQYYNLSEIVEFYNNPLVEKNVKEYFLPIVIKDTLFDIDYDFKKTEFNYTDIDLAFIKFYKNEFNKLTSYESSKIVLLQELFDKYIKNKRLVVTPAGINICENTSTIKQVNKLKLITNYTSDISLDMLSSGEKKILLLLAISIFIENIIIIIDEPELSLSITWQKQIVTDLIDRTNIKSLFIATHSPYIPYEKSLFDSIIYLPTNGVIKND